MKYKNLAEMFFSKRQEMPDKTGYMFKAGGEWQKVSFKEAVDKAEKIAAGLASLGVTKGDKVGLMAPNGVEWALSDYAAQSLGALLAPIYPSLLSEQAAYILNDSEAKVVIVGDEMLLDKIEAVRSKLETVKDFFVIVPSDGGLKSPWKSLDDLAKSGEEFLVKDKDYVLNSIQKVETDDWATLVYTSGTTGEPKGAILTHRNFLSNVEAASSVIDVFSEDDFLSFLPLSHVFERMAGHFFSCYHGSMVAYAESVDTVAANMTEVKPTIMVSVPRLYEKIYSKVLDSVESGSPVKRKIFYWALKVGGQYISCIMNKKPISGALQFKRNLAYKLVFSKLYEKVGARLRFFVSGGAPLPKEIGEFFGAAGMIILEGYGLTETSPLISVNILNNFKFGTVGPVAPGVEVKIADDGEILSRGDHIMVGYFKKEAETKEAIDEEGWFHTGDIGLIDEDGFLKITDRKKNIIVTSGGKNIAPQPIEAKLVTSVYIEQAVVIGDKRKFCSAAIVPSEEVLTKWAEDNNKSGTSFADLIKTDEVRAIIRKEIDKVSTNLARYETIKEFILIPEQFTIESGELTPSMKVKRNVVEKNYADEINKIYEV